MSSPSAPAPKVTELTLSNIEITKFSININNTKKINPDNDYVQPSVNLDLEGKTKEKPESTFNFEAYVTQRLDEDQS